MPPTTTRRPRPSRAALNPGRGKADGRAMDERAPSSIPLRRGVALRMAATLALALVALDVIDRATGQPGLVASLVSPSQASAQGESDAGGPFSAAQQRKDMIAELRQINSRLERLESKLSSGLTVKVTDMPALKLPPELRAPAPRADAAPATNEGVRAAPPAAPEGLAGAPEAAQQGSPIIRTRPLPR